MVIYGDLMGFMGIYRGYNGYYHLVMTFTVCHGKIHHAIKNGKPSISMPWLPRRTVSHNQRVVHPEIMG